MIPPKLFKPEDFSCACWEGDEDNHNKTELCEAWDASVRAQAVLEKWYYEHFTNPVAYTGDDDEC